MILYNFSLKLETRRPIQASYVTSHVTSANCNTVQGDSTGVTIRCKLYNLYIAIPVADDFVIADDFWSGVG